ncbi:MAG: carboxypeptidase regulatory-like domain-containing protein, partial [Candidatus Wildermuthbacteria bacterium]|nr:carboxypeptidase regulatory-like domain-containing protein [Candidatus Wildermuthbacteria bacterium]
REFVLAPLPAGIANLVAKFPQLAQTLEEVGIGKFTDVGRLQTTKLTLPGLGEISHDIPTEIVFATLRLTPLELQRDEQAQGEAIDIPAVVTITDKGEPQQRITTIASKPLHLAIKPEYSANRVKGYLVFRSRTPSASEGGILQSAFFASALFATPAFAQTYNPEDIETRLVLLEFDYIGPDQNGLYTADIAAPVADGEYEIITVIEYEDPEKGTKAIRLITVVDPEGYVYRKIGNEEARISGAIVSLIWLNPETKQYELWPAKDYQQENPQVTDITGRYSFLVPEGEYYLGVEAPGYLPYQSEVLQVTEGTGIHENIELKTQYGWLKALDWKIVVLIIFGVLLFYNFYRDRIRKRSHET